MSGILQSAITMAGWYSTITSASLVDPPERVVTEPEVRSSSALVSEVLKETNAALSQPWVEGDQTGGPLSTVVAVSNLGAKLRALRHRLVEAGLVDLDLQGVRREAILRRGGVEAIEDPDLS